MYSPKYKKSPFGKVIAGSTLNKRRFLLEGLE